jgi:hypothetical protein
VSLVRFCWALSVKVNPMMKQTVVILGENR